MAKVSILIDGSNFYFKLNDLGLQNQLDFDFLAFCNHLAGPDTTVARIYYIGAVKTDGTKKMAKLHANQQKLFSYLKENKFRYELGYLLKSKGKFSEKGVDVHLATDILVNAYEKKCDKTVLISSDTDLIPAIKKAMSIGHPVEYIGFEHQPSMALKNNCSSYRLLSKEQLEQFIPSPNP